MEKEKMSFKADFYVGIGKNAEWLGSILNKGDVWFIPTDILLQVNETMFRETVWNFLNDSDCTSKVCQDQKMKNNWPHLYPTSKETDYVFMFDPNSKKVLMYQQECDLLLDPIKIIQGFAIEEAIICSWDACFPCMTNTII
jgi:hypothetical protein